MKVCLFPSCVNTEEGTPEKSFFKEPVEERLPKRCGRQVKFDNNSPRACEDHSNFENTMENYTREEQVNAKSVLNKDAVPNNFLDLKLEDSTVRCQEIQEEAAMEPSKQVPLKDMRVNVNILKQSRDSYSQKEDTNLAASFNCMLCQHVFSSQASLAAHFSNCIMHLEFAHVSPASEPTTNCSEQSGLEKPEHNNIYDCKICFAKFTVKCTYESHLAKCKYQHKQGNKDLIPKSSPMKPELPVFYYCNICFVGFDEEHAWEAHLANCEYTLKQAKKDQNDLTTSFTKESSKDVLHEKVIEDESWLVTSLPEGYECVDAMFVVEAEGTCMLQQQIPVEPEEEQLEVLEEKRGKDILIPDRGTSPLEQDSLPPWRLSLLADALEAEEEKEMMEQKLVLEPRFLRSAFLCMRGQPPDNLEQPVEEPLEEPSVVTDVLEVEKVAVAEDASPIADFINVKTEPEELKIKVACH